MPRDSNVKLFVTSWQGFEVDGFEVPENVDGIDTITYNVQIPLKNETIQVRLFGSADREEQLHLLLRQVLDGLDGESNWFPSIAPLSIAGNEYYGIVLLCLGILGFVAGLVILWYISQSSPKGTILLIAILLFLLSGTIKGSRIREAIMLFSMIRLLGIAHSSLESLIIYEK